MIKNKLLNCFTKQIRNTTFTRKIKKIINYIHDKENKQK